MIGKLNAKDVQFIIPGFFLMRFLLNQDCTVLVIIFKHPNICFSFGVVLVRINRLIPLFTFDCRHLNVLKIMIFHRCCQMSWMFSLE